MSRPVPVIAELEEAVRGNSSEKRVDTLRQVTALFLNDGGHLTDEQVKVFDDVLCHLVAQVETRVKAELGEKLAQLAYAPSGVIEQLAWDEAIAVAGPVLENSTCVSATALIEIAKHRGQNHLLAISGRRDLSEALTDVIVERGERDVIGKLAANANARFSAAGQVERNNRLDKSSKRRATRYRVAKSGSIKFGERVIDCLVRSLSRTGAGMDVVNCQYTIPSRFELTIPGDGLKQLCRVVWRKDHRVGVVFVFPTDATT